MQHTFRYCPICRSHLRWMRVDGQKRLACQKCGWIYYRNPLPVAVSVAVNKEDKILVVKRNLKPGINKWSLPGGFIESGEEPGSACLRELKEETGLKGEIIRLIGVYTYRSRMYGPLLVIGYKVIIREGSPQINSELKEAKFVFRRNLPKIPFSAHRKIIQDARKT